MEGKRLKLAFEIVVNSLVLNIFEDMLVSKNQHGDLSYESCHIFITKYKNFNQLRPQYLTLITT